MRRGTAQRWRGPLRRTTPGQARFSHLDDPTGLSEKRACPEQGRARTIVCVPVSVSLFPCPCFRCTRRENVAGAACRGGRRGFSLGLQRLESPFKLHLRFSRRPLQQWWSQGIFFGMASPGGKIPILRGVVIPEAHWGCLHQSECHLSPLRCASIFLPFERRWQRLVPVFGVAVAKAPLHG